MKAPRWFVIVVAASVAAGACSRSSGPSHVAATSTPRQPTVRTVPASPCSVALQATDVGITPRDITVEVMTDVGSPFTQGEDQDVIDALNAFAARVNTHGGLACRQLKVRTWDSKLDSAEAKNGQIDACQNAFAMVGTTAGVNTDVSSINSCVDSISHATGLPDVAGFSSEDTQCAPTIFTVFPVGQVCPRAHGDNTYTEQIGYMKWQLAHDPGLHGLYLIQGDVPALTVGEIPLMTAFQQAGMGWDAVPKVSLGDTQTGYTPRVQIARVKGSTYVYNGAIDTSLIFMRREAAAQEETSVNVWGCGENCYSKSFLDQGGKDVEGTYIWLNFLPFEEASSNADLAAFVNGVGPSKADLGGAYSWQAADAFQDAVNAAVAKDGPNGVTRATLVSALKSLTHFDAHGWAAPHALSGEPPNSPCFAVMQVQNGRFVRVYPTTPGTMDCNPSNLAAVTVDAAAVAATLK